MAFDEIINPAEHPDETRSRRLLQVGIPVATVLLILLTIAGIGWYSYKTTRAGALDLTRKLLTTVQRYVVQDVTTYLSAATVGAGFAQDFLGHASPKYINPAFYAYGASMLRLVPQLQSFYLADDNGELLVIERDPGGDGMERTIVRGEPGQRVFHHDFYNAAGKLIRSSDEPGGNYDPRHRDWFQKAVGSKDVVWGEPTVYVSNRKLVITSSLGFSGEDGVRRVFAVNTSLDQLSEFLSNLHISDNGEAAIIDATGHVIAVRGVQDLMKSVGNDPQKMTLDKFSNQRFLKIYDHYRVQGTGTYGFQDGKKFYLGMSQNLPQTNGWLLMISAPAGDFASFVITAGRQSILFSLIIVALACVLAGLLAAQSRKAERARRTIVRMNDRIEQEKGSLRHVVAERDLFSTKSEPLVLTEEIALMTGARRATVWRLVHDGESLICDDVFDSREGTHSGGFELTSQNCAGFFKLIEPGSQADVADARADERTKEFERQVMREHGTRHLFVHPVYGSEGISGVITLEDAPLADKVFYFIDIISGIVAARFANAPDIDGASPLPEPSAPSEPPRFDSGIYITEKHSGEIRKNFYPQVAVMVIAFADPVMEDPEATDGLVELIDEIVRAGQEIAKKNGLYSVKLAGHRLICVAGCNPDPEPDAIIRIAEAALGFREVCMRVLAKANIEPAFNIGIDLGSAFGGELGDSPAVFNLWGETVTRAELMAHDALDVGTIEVSEHVYVTLRDHYLFRSRGYFYTPRGGVSHVYTLAARR
ncbi:histidine kinase [Acetobacter sp. AN02]|uniref:cache domain-containing protein n=1 Tax=Acetobacter sp. AN02 TaxID=2894186 RepID=UPI0024343B27|nr:adenylate/guanylate cyclase domain-containing protein [Acetobacter sp. AN02]MDG6094661.1 histidine kinase [Acetobacter sp. AN02]